MRPSIESVNTTTAAATRVLAVRRVIKRLQAVRQCMRPNLMRISRHRGGRRGRGRRRRWCNGRRCAGGLVEQRLRLKHDSQVAGERTAGNCAAPQRQGLLLVAAAELDSMSLPVKFSTTSSCVPQWQHPRAWPATNDYSQACYCLHEQHSMACLIST